MIDTSKMLREFYRIPEVCSSPQDFLIQRRALATQLSAQSSQSNPEVDAVRARLAQWGDYHDNRSSSQPYSKDVTGQVAENVYRQRKPTLRINTPDKKIDLRVSDETILRMLSQARTGQKYLF